MLINLIFALIGIILWTFLEYIIHRFLGHQKKGKQIIQKEHLRHHSEANYFAPIQKKLLLANTLFVFLTLLIGLVFTFQMGIYFALGFAGMYFLYEITHRRFHIKEPLIRYGLRMRKHHFFHHFGNPSLNHGVTTAFWDRVFRTYKKPEIVRVPRKMSMVWLEDDEKHLKPKFEAHFFLK